MPGKPGSGDPMVFRPPLRRRGLQLALGLPLTVLVLVPTAFAAWLVWAPHSVELEVAGGKLHITTAPEPLTRHRTVDLATVRSVESVQLGRGTRVAGTALPGYCVGHYRYPGIGDVWQATDCSHEVLILRRNGERPLVLTPPDPDRFRRAVDAGAGYHESQPLPEPGPYWLIVKVAILLAPLAALVVPAVFLVAPVRLRYRVEPGTLVVTTILGSRRFTTTGASASSHHPKVGLKLWGTGAPGYYTGLYRVDGANARIYTTSVEDGVLIEGEGLRLFVNPENEDAFLEALCTLGGANRILSS